MEQINKIEQELESILERIRELEYADKLDKNEINTLVKQLEKFENMAVDIAKTVQTKIDSVRYEYKIDFDKNERDILDKLIMKINEHQLECNIQRIQNKKDTWKKWIYGIVIAAVTFAFGVYKDYIKKLLGF